MANKIVGKSYIVYDARTMTIHHSEAAILLVTKDKQEAIKYASDHGVTVYSYDVCEDGELINTTFIYHLANLWEIG